MSEEVSSEVEPLSLVDGSSEKNSHMKYRNTTNMITKSKIHKLIYFLMMLVLIVLSIVLSLHYKESTYHMLSYILASVIVPYFMAVSHTLLTIKHFHLIIIERKSFSSFNKTMIVPYKMPIQHKNKPVKSTSSLFATHGTCLHQINLYFTVYIIGICLSAIVMKLNESIDIHLIVFLVSVFGWSMLEMFELDTHNVCDISFIMHWIGAIILFFGCPLAFLIQQNHSTLSIVLLVMCYVFNILFIVVGTLLMPNNHNDSKKVNQISIFSIGSELMSMLVLAAIVVLYVFCLDNDQIIQLT
eukprot:14759_1